MSTGSSLGPYRIEDKLGEGGMGEVYRARDTRLNRYVAVKVLPAAFALDVDRHLRLRREAELLAALNHPHIAAVYGLEETANVTALVLELVEGPTLADRLTEGPVPIGEALAIARQVAEALEAAHERGVVHRDLKPANIKLRPDGTVKILDFGLAKSLEQTGAPPELPTVLSPAPTLAGLIVGTPAYMSPEQARGLAVDERSDIWAFGCVLYETLSGRRPFTGETVTDILAAVINNEPDWQALPQPTPTRIRSLVARCLRKDPMHRLRDIADGRFQIEETLNDPGVSTLPVAQVRTRREWMAWTAATLLLGTTLYFATRPVSTSISGSSIRFPVFPPDEADFSARPNTTLNVPAFALSPDGHALVFSAQIAGAKPVLWVRSLNQVDARPLAGTEGAEDAFWSPDNEWIGFFADGMLKKVPASGGAVQTINHSINDYRGATWGRGDLILVASGVDGIFSLNAAGGPTRPVTVVDGPSHENTHRNPAFLPDGQHFFYTVIGSGDRGGVYVGSLDGKTKKRLIPYQTSAVYAPPGYLLFVNGATLFGQAFDTDHLELEGQPFFVAEHVGLSTSFLSAVSASLTGHMAYGPLLVQNGRLTWLDRRGNPIGSPVTPRDDYADFRLSPDYKRLAASRVDPKTSVVELWITDLERGSPSKVVSGGSVTAAAIWSPDGTRLVFRSNRTGVIELYERSAAGGGGERMLLSKDVERFASFTATDWSPDGRQLVGVSARTRKDLWLLPLEKDGRPVTFVASPAEELHGNFSPKNGLVAYTSNQSGRFEIYVETVPQSDRKPQISINGGYEPRWRDDGTEIYYLSEDRVLMAVPVGPGPSFGIPTPLFQTHVPPGISALRTHYVPGPKGERFLVNVSTDTAASPITVMLNWTASVKQ